MGLDNSDESNEPSKKAAIPLFQEGLPNPFEEEPTLLQRTLGHFQRNRSGTARVEQPSDSLIVDTYEDLAGLSNSRTYMKEQISNNKKIAAATAVLMAHNGAEAFLSFSVVGSGKKKGQRDRVDHSKGELVALERGLRGHPHHLLYRYHGKNAVKRAWEDFNTIKTALRNPMSCWDVQKTINDVFEQRASKSLSPATLVKGSK